MSGDSLDNIAKPGMTQAYGADKESWLITDDFRQKTPSLFKPEFVGTRGASKCYLVQDQNKIGKNKYSCKGVSKKHNDLYFECYKNVLDFFQKKIIDSDLEG